MSDSEDDLALIGLHVISRQKRTRRRTVWTHNVIGRRLQLAEYHRLIQELRLDSDRFQKRQFRMSPAIFDELLSVVGPHLATFTPTSDKQQTPLRDWQ